MGLTNNNLNKAEIVFSQFFTMFVFIDKVSVLVGVIIAVASSRSSCDCLAEHGGNLSACVKRWPFGLTTRFLSKLGNLSTDQGASDWFAMMLSVAAWPRWRSAVKVHPLESSKVRVAGSMCSRLTAPLILSAIALVFDSKPRQTTERRTQPQWRAKGGDIDTQSNQRACCCTAACGTNPITG